MKIQVIRKIYSANSIISDILINDAFFCHGLEDRSRDDNRDGDLADAGEAKVFGKTAIPAGNYDLVISFSNRFKKRLPEVINVLGFAGIRIHAGNIPADTHGCLLVGVYSSHMPDFISNSRIVFSKLMSKLEIATKFEKIKIEYIDQSADELAA